MCKFFFFVASKVLHWFAQAHWLVEVLSFLYFPQTNQTGVSLLAWVSLWSCIVTEFLHSHFQVEWIAKYSKTFATVNVRTKLVYVLMMVCALHPMVIVYVKVQEGIISTKSDPNQQHPETSCMGVLWECVDLYNWDSCIKIGWLLFWHKVNVWHLYNSKLLNLVFLWAFWNKMQNVERIKILNYCACNYFTPPEFMTPRNCSRLLLSGRVGEHT